MDALSQLWSVLCGLSAVSLPLLMAALGAITVAGTAFALRRERTRRRRWLADQLGLTANGDVLSGTLDGRAVRLWSERRGAGKHKKTWHLTAIDLPELPAGFTVARQHLLATGRDRVLGDRPFDAAFRVDVDGDGLGFLDADVRARLLELPVEAVRSGRLVLEERRSWSAERVRSWVAFAGRMTGGSATERLWAMAERDPAPGVRVLALEELRQRAPDGAATRALLEAAAASEVLLVRVSATILLGRAEGLTEGLSALDEADRHASILRVRRMGTEAQVLAVLRSFAGAVPRPHWFAATDAAAVHPTPEVLRAVADAVERTKVDEFVADRATVALTACRDPSAEPLLLPLVRRTDRERDAALKWLAGHGTVAAVPLLDELIDASFPLTDARRAAETAKAAIQARLRGRRGDLALAGDDGRGGLALAASAAGRLAEGRSGER